MPSDKTPIPHELQIVEISLEEVSPDDTYRNRLKLENVDELAASIDLDGQQAPIVLRVRPDGSHRYQLICGFRRFSAIQSLGRPTVKAIIHTELSNSKAHKLSLIENLERDSLTNYEHVLAANKMREDGLSVKEIAALFHLTDRSIQRYFRLQKCSSEVKEALHDGLITISVAHEVETKDVELEKVIEKGLSVRKIQEMARGKKKRKTSADYIRCRNFKGGNFNLTLKYKAGITDLDEAIKTLEEALQKLVKVKAEADDQ